MKLNVLFHEKTVEHAPSVGAVRTAALESKIQFLLDGRTSLPGHCAVQPPSRTKAAPVIFDAGSLHRKTTMAARSFASVKRWLGSFSTSRSRVACSTEIPCSLALASICF